MPQRLHLALSPLLLSTRETPAIAALVLADRVVTLLPEPAAETREFRGDSRESVRAAIDAAPSYLRLLESWRWSAPLWKTGVLGRGSAGIASQDLLRSIYARIENERELAGLRRWTRHVLELQRAGTVAPPGSADPFEQESDADEGATDTHPTHGHCAPVLQALCADVLKGGPDPGFNIPLAAALDAFALGHGLLSVRASIDSLTQRAETRLARRVFTLGLPMLTRGSGLAILRLREALKNELAVLRGSLVDALTADREQSVGTHKAGVGNGDGQAPRSGPSAADLALKAAGDHFTRAFESWSRVHVPGDDERGERLTVGYCSLSLVALPPDAALLSAQAAMGALGAVSSRASASPVAPVAPAAPLTRADAQSSPHRALSSEILYALVVKELNVRPEHAPTGPTHTRNSVGAKS